VSFLGHLDAKDVVLTRSSDCEQLPRISVA
jgi:hypothetical protein